LTLEEMARRADDGERFQGYSVSASGRIIVTQLEAPRFIGRDALCEVVLDSGQTIFCTPDHQLMTSHGRMVAADDLRPGDSLMSLYRQPPHAAQLIPEPLDEYFSQAVGKLNVQHPRREASAALTQASARARVARDISSRPTIHSSRPAIHIERDGSAPEQSARALRLSARHESRRVARINDVAGEHDVYCLTVPEAGNFALQAGVFVHNCGIIVNVTPFEPEWEGYVTLEFSNTTPMPAKIYANEGVAQVIFFESDETCEISYKDRGGKYQGQHGVTPPKL
jgi:hypothetical protein